MENTWRRGGMGKQYQHRIGACAEICFNLVLDARNPGPDQLVQAVTEILKLGRALERHFSALRVRGVEEKFLNGSKRYRFSPNEEQMKECAAAGKTHMIAAT